MTELSDSLRARLRHAHARVLGLSDNSPLLDMDTIERWSAGILAGTRDLVSVLNGDAVPVISSEGVVSVRPACRVCAHAPHEGRICMERLMWGSKHDADCGCPDEVCFGEGQPWPEKPEK